MRLFRIPPHLTLLAAAFAVLILLLVLLPVITYPLRPAGQGQQVMVIVVPPGTPLSRMARQLEDGRIIASARHFTLYGRLKGAQSRLQAGAYQVSDGLPPAEILRKMMAGEVYVERFAVPEGYSIYQLAELLEGRSIMAGREFLAACLDRALLAEFGITADSAEGYLFPSTYDLPPGMGPQETVRLMLRTFFKVYDERFAHRPAPAGLTRHQLVTLASLVEKEARVPSERPLIASVFLNRLARRMPLQSDPTSVYGIRPFAGTVTAADVRRRTPYNTYLIRGLPPGPIGNPGPDALEAVLQPASTGYLYFVARQDGTHFFSSSLDEHNKAVTRYLRSGARPARTTE